MDSNKTANEGFVCAATGSESLEGAPRHIFLAANAETVHWGYFSKELAPRASVRSGDFATIEVLTHHANDDAERMVEGDSGAESVFRWTESEKAVPRRGAGTEADGGGFGVHICTGPIYVEGAEPGDVLEVRILDVRPRPAALPKYAGRTFGSNAAANWGFHYRDLLTEPKPREVITIYEIDAAGQDPWAKAVYNYRWTPQHDPCGKLHPTIDYPGVPVDHGTIEKNFDVLKGVRVPIRPHFGVVAVAPKEADMVNSIPPGYFGGNIDNWRIGKGGTIYLPVAVQGALFSVGDSHASQGDAELCGTAIECSLTGTFQFVLHKRGELAGTPLEGLDYPLLETAADWVIHGFSYPNYLADLAERSDEVFTTSTIDAAMRDAFRKMRRFLMVTKNLSEDEAISLMSVAVDFGISQVVDGNIGVHAILRKDMFTD
ncbi:acetamidase/formamidase family protein [Mesorhizobium sp. BR1-1-16]|uniref:acetamidase/formamidase family protein n=1 Tax=Mesorhizobium sp. BR1-1-16 TaxID=2876653 RepID=UPI001CCF6A40|nr:acetamidase/formamidase family protein [Mesorhizobium sp. BR1-1-16]MBZ9935621.1 acetamidase/formamidase family protein [Mesorhizobium sp. BR1-1-16]